MRKIPLRALARQALEQRRRERAAAEAHRRTEERARRRSELEHLLKEQLGIDVTPNDAVVVIDDITLTVTHRHVREDQYTWELVLVDRCPRCNELCASDGISALSHLGELLEQPFRPGPDHTCSTQGEDEDLLLLLPSHLRASLHKQPTIEQ